MNTVVIVDNDSKQILSYKRMLQPYSEEINCVCFQYPEAAIDYILEHPVAVLIYELDLPVMSAKEMFDMVEMISPATIKVAVSDVKDISKTLDIMNYSRVFKLIIKPFFLIEDLLNPIRASLQYYQQQIDTQVYQRNVAVELEILDKRAEELNHQLEDKKKSYTSIYNATVGIIRANLRYGRIPFREEERLVINRVFEGLFQEFMRYYMFEPRNYIFHANYLQNLFHHPQEDCTFQIRNRVGKNIENETMQQMAYVIFISGYMCRKMVRTYQIAASIDMEDDNYVVKIYYKHPEGTLDFKFQSERTRKVMLFIVDEIVRAISEKVCRTKENNPLLAKIYFRKGEETV